MSSSLMYTLTKLRSFPCSLYRCVFSPSCRRVRSASNSPIVAPVASTMSCLSVYGRSGVGMRIFAMMQTALFERRTIVFQEPHGHVGGGAAHDRYDDIGKSRPRVIQIVLRRPRRMIRMRVVEPEQLPTEVGRAPLRLAIVRRADQKAAPRSFVGRVRERHHGIHQPSLGTAERASRLAGPKFGRAERRPADERAAAFVGKRF